MGVDRHLVARVDCSTRAKSLPVQEVCVKKAKSLPTIGIYRPPAARRLEAPVKDQEAAACEEVTPTATATTAAKNDKQRSVRRRPDIQVYVPRAKRALIGDLRSGNVECGSKSMPCSERRSSSQKQNLDSDMSSHQTPRTEQLTTRPPENEDKLSCNEVSNKEIGRCRQLHRQHLSSRKNNHGEDPPIAEDKLSSDASSSCKEAANQFQRRISENASPLNNGCEGMNNKNCDPGHLEIAECGPLTCTESTSENKPEVSKNGFDNEERSPVNPSGNSSNGFMMDSKEPVEKEKQNHSSDEVQSSNRTAQHTELRNTMQSLDITGDNGMHIKKKDSDDECKKEEHRRTRRILRRNFMSDVLIISDVQVHSEVPLICPDVRDESSSRDAEQCLPEKSATNSETAADDVVEETSPIELPKLNSEDCTWDMMFDDNGDCLDPKLMEELTRAVGSVVIEKPQSDYRSYQSKLEMFMSGSGDEFGHVIEIYNFPAAFKTEDLLSIFSPYKNGGFEIKWVDDTHALGVFSSSRVAAEVLSHEHPLVKTRPLSQATHESRSKARRVAEFLQPYRARPETCAALARRLVTGALGVRLQTSQEEREAERRLLREAREKKRLAAKQREAAWEGTFSEQNKTI